MGFSWPFFPSSAPCREALRCAGGDGLPYLIIMPSTMRMLVCESVRLFAATWGVYVFALPVCKSRRTTESFIIVRVENGKYPLGVAESGSDKCSKYWITAHICTCICQNITQKMISFSQPFKYRSALKTPQHKVKNSEVIMTTATLHYSQCHVRMVYDCCEHRGCVAVSLLR